MSAAEVAKDAKIPRTSAYDILNSFVKKNYCFKFETPTKLLYEIIDTHVVESKLKIGIESEYKNKLSDLQECFRYLKPHFKENQAPEYKAEVELLKGYNMYREHKFVDLINSSTKAILIMNRFKGYISNELDNQVAKFYKRGGRWKSIYEASTDFKIKINDKWQSITREGLLKLCKTFIKQGEQIKLLKDVPQIMAVFDEKIVYFSLYDENIKPQDATDIIVKNKRFAKFITELFNVYWDKADTLELLKKQIKSITTN